MAMLLLWILSLAASFILPATGEVVDSFQNCPKFFLGGNPPSNLQPLNPARICQHYKGSYRFATMYDRDGRIPRFSAYKYLPAAGRSLVDWKIEPQLALPDDRQRISMESEQTCRINYRDLAKSQAVSEDYANVFPYDKGQLVPASHQPDDNSKAATYTFTNTVPQFQALMNGEWDDFLRDMSQSTAGCRETYVIVGVVPGDDSIAGGQVNKPSYIWAAVCCLTKKDQKQSFGAIAENNQDRVDRLSLRELESKLNGLYGNSESELNSEYSQEEINLFNGECY